MWHLIRNALAALVLLLVVGAIAFAVIAWRPEVAAIATPPARAAFDRKDIEQGAALAAIGNCDVCHTAAGSAFYAGGRSIPTPFGTVYATNNATLFAVGQSSRLAGRLPSNRRFHRPPLPLA